MTILAEVRRLFGQEAGGGNDSWQRAALKAVQFDLSKVDTVKPKGHVVAVRVTSEDPDDGFKPTSGHVQVNLLAFLSLMAFIYSQGRYACKVLVARLTRKITTEDNGLIEGFFFLNHFALYKICWCNKLDCNVTSANPGA